MMLLTVLITYLCFAGTTSKFYLTKKNVQWNQTKQHCEVPSVNDIGYFTNFLLPEHFTAWTASKVSDTTWGYFYGCLDLQVNNVEVFRQLNNYFPSDPKTVVSINIFDCQKYCSMRGDYFVYYTKKWCKCIYSIKGYPVSTLTLICIQSCTDQHIYCSSYKGLPLFKLKRDIDTTLIQNTSYSHQCLALVNSTMTVKDCTIAKSDVHCKGNINYNATNSTWQVAINHCPRLPLRRMGNIDTWLGHFRKRSSEDELCTAVSKTRGKIIHRYMSCLDTLWILCTEELESITSKTNQLESITSKTNQLESITSKTNHTDLSSQISATVAVDSLDNGTSGPTDTNATTESTESKRLIVFINAALLVLCICLAVVVVIRKCRQRKGKILSFEKQNGQNVHPTSLTSVPNRLDNRLVTKPYDDTWERCHNKKRNQNEAFPDNQPTNRMIKKSNELHHNTHTNKAEETPSNQQPETKILRGSYAEPWELRHNIVHMAEIYHSTDDNPAVPMFDDTDV